MRNQKLARAIKRARARGFERGWYVVSPYYEDTLRIAQSPQDVGGRKRPGLLQSSSVVAGPLSLFEATAEKKRLLSSSVLGSLRPSAPAE